MEIIITIRDTAAGEAPPVVQIGARAGAPPSAAGGPEQTASVTGAAIAGGQAPYAAGRETFAQRGSAVQPPQDVLRAAAASGAANGGPAPMLSNASIDTASGAPQPYIGTGREAPTQAAQGAQDQSGGAAPGAEQIAPAVTIRESREGGER